jgi:hypothetical protein
LMALLEWAEHGSYQEEPQNPLMGARKLLKRKKEGI